MNGIRKLWGDGSSSTSSRTPQTPVPVTPVTPISPAPSALPSSKVASVTDAGNGNDANDSDRSALPASSRVTSSLRKPVPTPTPVPGPSSPRILPLQLPLQDGNAPQESRECEILSGEEVEELKKEHQILKIRLAAAQRKLKLETKIRDAALSLSKVNIAHKKVSKATDDQLDAAERRVNAAQTELWRVSERANEVERKLLEHRTGVLGFFVAKMERKMTPSPRYDYLSTTESAIRRRTPFEGNADAQIPKAPPSVNDVVALEDKLRVATEALSIANQKQAEMARELSHLRLEKEQIETTMGMELQTAEETVVALEQEFPRLEELNAKCQGLLEEHAQWEKDKTQLAAREKEVERLERRHAGKEDAKEEWEVEKAVMEEDKLAELGALQNELERNGRWRELRWRRINSQSSLHDIQISPDTSLQGLLASVASHPETLSAVLQGHSDRHACLGDDLRVHVGKNETLSKDLDAVRLERDSAQLEVQSLELRVKELIDTSSTPFEPPVEYTGEAADIIAILQPIWNILPAPELRASKLDSKPHLRNPSIDPQTISTSYGDHEQTVPYTYAIRVYAGIASLDARGVSLLFSSGDGGVGDADADPATQFCKSNDGRNVTDFLPTFPCSYPYLTAVGGTINIPETAVYFSSGGFSDYFARPAYQEVAVSEYLVMLAPDTFEGLFNSTGRVCRLVNLMETGQEGSIGGTSCASPAFAGFVSMLNDALINAGETPLGFLNPLLYSTGYTALNDFTQGNNPGCGTLGFNATDGWDPVTGHGTPNFEKLKVLVLTLP
ncbi:hypothetical protein C8R48DRAFT_782571 [Suillus tomentosus]|nr:hypothetical protein C8R48DRAFT_782571 [Suillus tomentosus]